MKVIITGDKDIHINNLNLVHDAIVASKFKVTQVLSGTSEGADKLGEKWAGLQKINVRKFPPQWKDITAPGASVKTGKYGPYNSKAGFDRNSTMVEIADAVIILSPNEMSVDAKDIADKARKKGIQVFQFPEVKAEASTEDFVYVF